MNDRTLVWSDEFDGKAESPPNPDYWTHEVGGDGWSHEELQYYSDRIENAAQDGQGHLAMVARRETVPGLHCFYGACRYTSARLTTRKRLTFQFGRVEARIQIPRGQGLWPAFWMVGSHHDMGVWPVSGEIDILEAIGRQPDIAHAAVHGPGYYADKGITGRARFVRPLANDFHVYAVEWEPGAIRWLLDGTLYHKVTKADVGKNPWVFDHHFYINLNVAVGGWWPGNPDESTVFPQTMLIDYVRVYQSGAAQVRAVPRDNERA